MPKPANKQNKAAETDTRNTVNTAGASDDVTDALAVDEETAAGSAQEVAGGAETVGEGDTASASTTAPSKRRGAVAGVPRGPMLRWTDDQLLALHRHNKEAAGSLNAVELREKLINDPAFDGVDPSLITATKVSQQVNRMRAAFAEDERDVEAPRLKRMPNTGGGGGRKGSRLARLFGAKGANGGTDTAGDGTTESTVAA